MKMEDFAQAMAIVAGFAVALLLRDLVTAALRELQDRRVERRRRQLYEDAVQKMRDDLEARGFTEVHIAELPGDQLAVAAVPPPGAHTGTPACECPECRISRASVSKLRPVH